jgi:hypothetical protein
MQRLRFVNVETKAVTLVDTATAFRRFRQYAWSPDSAWVTWARFGGRGPHAQGLAVLARRTQASSRSRTAGTRPTAPNVQRRRQVPGFFASGPRLQADDERHRASTTSTRTWNGSTWSRSQRTPTPPSSRRSDEVSIAAPTSVEKSADAKAPNAKDEKPAGAKAVEDQGREEGRQAANDVVVKVDEDGHRGPHDRPADPGGSNYDTISAVGDKVYYLRSYSERQRVTTRRQRAAEDPRWSTDLKDLQGDGTRCLWRATRSPHDEKKMLVKVGQGLRDRRPPDLVGTETSRIRTKVSLLAARDDDRPARRVEPDLQRELAPDARLLLLAHDERGRLAGRCAPSTPALVPYVQTRYDLTYLIGETDR